MKNFEQRTCRKRSLYLFLRCLWFSLMVVTFCRFSLVLPAIDREQTKTMAEGVPWFQDTSVNDTRLPGPTTGWEFFFISAFLDSTHNSVYLISLTHDMFARPEEKRVRAWIEDNAPKSYQPNKLIKSPWEGQYEEYKTDTSCRNSTWLGKNHRPDLCMNRIRDLSSMCNQNFFALGVDGNCLCIHKDGCPEYVHRFVTIYRILYKKAKKWECFLPEFDIAADVRWAPTTANLDSNCNDVMNVAICSFKSGHQFNSQQHVVVQLRQSNKDSIFQTRIPLFIGATGRFKPSPFIHKVPRRSSFPNILMCVHMFGTAAFYWVLEFIVHHLNIGVSHIFIGFYDYADSLNYLHISKLLSFFIDRKLVSLMSLKIPFIDWGYMALQEYLYGECLYFAKIRGDLVMMSDVDEFIVPHTQDSLDTILQLHLQKTQTRLEGLCSISFQSYSLAGNYSGNSFQWNEGFMAARFTHRDVDVDPEFVKTMSYSPHVFNQGAHTPAACTVSGIQNMIKPNVTTGALLLPSTIASIHHFFQAVRIRGRKYRQNQVLQHEYGKIWSKLAEDAFCWFMDQSGLSKEYFEELTQKNYDCELKNATKPFWDIPT